MLFSHYSRSNVLEPHSVTQRVQPYHKPRGLWLSVDGTDDWPYWCSRAEYECASYRFRVTIADGPLVLASEDALWDFTAEYGAPDIRWPGVDKVDWLRVSRDHPGIVIAPYQWSLRMVDDVGWYYSWDCASACIWDISVIESVQLVEAKELAK